MLVSGKIQWHKTVDVVVVGLGAAGAVAAITAYDDGGDVIILEKQPAQNHISNSSMSVGVFLSVNNVSAATIYMENLCKVDGELYWTNKEIIRAWTECASQNREWVEKSAFQHTKESV